MCVRTLTRAKKMATWQMYGGHLADARAPSTGYKVILMGPPFLSEWGFHVTVFPFARRAGPLLSKTTLGPKLHSRKDPGALLDRFLFGGRSFTSSAFSTAPNILSYKIMTLCRALLTR